MAHPLHMEAEYLELRTKHPFIIARGGQSDYRTIWVRLKDADGHEGWGEAAPSRFYGETAETVLAAPAISRRTATILCSVKAPAVMRTIKSIVTILTLARSPF